MLNLSFRSPLSNMVEDKMHSINMRKSFRVFYLTAFYTAHRVRNKAAIRLRFSHKLSTLGQYIRQATPKRM